MIDISIRDNMGDIAAESYELNSAEVDEAEAIFSIIDIRKFYIKDLGKKRSAAY